ncbi:ABC transporter ATP-binding protein [Limnochorda pilosa]|uniref:Amino acid ABC transporter ATPase n=1 Tax=Limnochorda pilosa TaxID=1555112 RepID=A0A0K2SN60_LIMPI|nr:ABC transporter ATP-binding protein [Limnochorda pilosa]BAS28550.1 amino acid ABC transporter ATPase [Limnochorda pilosa]
MSLLEVRGLRVRYGAIEALHGIDLSVGEGEIVTLIGANGAGKTTTLRAISRLVAPRSGEVRFAGADLARLPAHRLVQLGICHVPEGRGIFANLTVLENLLLATYGRRDRPKVSQDLERVFGLFPRLDERKAQLAGTLSGGEQQMLAVGRALMTRGRLMLLDEPSMGLAPVLVEEIFETLAAINRDGTTLLLVEQNAHQALRLAHRGYVLETGTIQAAADAATLARDPEVRRAYLGG